jgi:hypothetical protein
MAKEMSFEAFIDVELNFNFQNIGEGCFYYLPSNNCL